MESDLVPRKGKTFFFFACQDRLWTSRSLYRLLKQGTTTSSNCFWTPRHCLASQPAPLVTQPPFPSLSLSAIKKSYAPSSLLTPVRSHAAHIPFCLPPYVCNSFCPSSALSYPEEGIAHSTMSVTSTWSVRSASWVQLRSYLEEIVAAPVYKTEITAIGIRRADHATPLYPQKLALTSLTSAGRSVGTVRSRTQATELYL
jgi:hypothetical protein